MSNRIRVLVVAVALAACHRRDPGPFGKPGDVRLSLDASVPDATPDSVVLRIRAVNRARQMRVVNVPHCPMSIAFATGRGAATRVWDALALQRSRGEDPGGFCLTYAILGEVAPGDTSVTYRTSIPIRAILGDSLPPGRYRAILGGNAKREGGLVSREIDLR